MISLSFAEKVELGSIPIITATAGLLSPMTGLKLEVSDLVAGAALLILLQGFVRDLWLLRQARQSKPASSGRTARCMCIESALGLTVVIAGIGLVALGFTRPVYLSTTSLTIGVAVAMLAGFALKDFVFEWSPWRIYREKDHAQVIFRRRK